MKSFWLAAVEKNMLYGHGEAFSAFKKIKRPCRGGKPEKKSWRGVGGEGAAPPPQMHWAAMHMLFFSFCGVFLITTTTTTTRRGGKLKNKKSWRGVGGRAQRLPPRCIRCLCICCFSCAFWLPSTTTTTTTAATTTTTTTARGGKLKNKKSWRGVGGEVH